MRNLLGWGVEMVYYHITAIENGDVKNILVSDYEHRQKGFNPSNYFAHGSTDVTVQGAVEIFPVNGDTGLPDVIG